MEALVTIVAVGAYAERQYQKQDGSSEVLGKREEYVEPVEDRFTSRHSRCGGATR